MGHCGPASGQSPHTALPWLAQSGVGGAAEELGPPHFLGDKIQRPLQKTAQTAS